MNVWLRILLALWAAIIAVFIHKCLQLAGGQIPVPHFDLDEYWGPGDKANYKEDKRILEYRIHYPDEVLADLTRQLNRTIQFKEPLEGVGFAYGFNTKRLKEIVNYWRDEYMPKWRSREEYLMTYPHYTTQIQGLQIHFLHTQFKNHPKGKKVYPMLLLHGWPGSVREFYDMLPKLIDNPDSDYAFEVVAPSLPGFAFSESTAKTGLGSAEIAIIMRNLMIRLGYDKFFIQCGDWGGLVGSHLSTIFPENVIGYHSNFCTILTATSITKTIIASWYPSYFVDEKYADFFFPLTEKIAYMFVESGYFHIQLTKPDTVGAALTASPIGLAAYMLEKFSTLTNADYRQTEDGGLEKSFTLEALLDNVMIYYLTNSITSASRLYAENFLLNGRSMAFNYIKTIPPAGCARFKHEVMHYIDWALEDKFVNLIHSTYYSKGGHFIAFEKPDVLYRDFIEFVDKTRHFLIEKSIEKEDDNL